MTKRKLMEYLITGQLALFLVGAPFLPRFHESLVIEGIIVGAAFFLPAIVLHMVLPADFTLGQNKRPRG
ncbi:MAG: hypothetical protein ACRBEQ_11760 [Hyphomonas sp.]